MGVDPLPPSVAPPVRSLVPPPVSPVPPSAPVPVAGAELVSSPAVVRGALVLDRAGAELLVRDGAPDVVVASSVSVGAGAVVVGAALRVGAVEVRAGAGGDVVRWRWSSGMAELGTGTVAPAGVTTLV